MTLNLSSPPTTLSNMARKKLSKRRSSGSLVPRAKPRPPPSTSEKPAELGEGKVPGYGVAPKSPPLTDPAEKVTVEAGTVGGESRKRIEEDVDTTSSGSSASTDESEDEDGKSQEDIGSESLDKVGVVPKAQWVLGDIKVDPVEECNDDDDDENEEEEEDWTQEGEAEAKNTLASRLGPTPDCSSSGDEAGVKQKSGVTKEDPVEVDDDDDDDDDEDMSSDEQLEGEEAKAPAQSPLASRLGPTPPQHSPLHSPIANDSDSSSSPSSSTLEHENEQEAQWNTWDTALRPRHHAGRGIGKGRLIGAWTNCRVPKEKWTPGVRQWVERKVAQGKME
ncbi:hypothetical protein SAICODRAFT_159746 [Saitoella complicata NRRL Y-17804]|uniref:Uncharacterized protein n=1 Tax=Saitoella complicata (strain BCRC 22490 / CBS 7301 / JCM 7358 / NBRC 10748 / NRRL Y-17804) TaxID=698492 RepID=A0A0E9NSH2_SAICN|nr:uncharacterized protein SAICODRAFT_159746 [Saitoella complicata NRRL Y-17804]ODQ51273.1 hypothetical protein SAICODRAFT_159746 [Saitoella complicata NRRL Y-17804]GAO52723.1 hypothetical protein G7K_6793-t1 [Saitoella complicata NRRL Y-17804]